MTRAREHENSNLGALAASRWAADTHGLSLDHEGWDILRLEEDEALEAAHQARIQRHDSRVVSGAQY